MELLELPLVRGYRRGVWGCKEEEEEERRKAWVGLLQEWIHPGIVLANTMWRGGAALMRRCFYDSGLKGIGTLLFYFSIINYALGCQVSPGFSGNTRQKLVLLPGF